MTDAALLDRAASTSAGTFSSPLTTSAPHLLDPESRRPLTRRHVVGDAAIWEGSATAWPEVDGIPYVRVGCEALVARVLSLLEAGRVDEARGELLRDQDDFARQPPPSLEEAIAVGRERPPLAEAMSRLEYGPVADYFLLRPSTPTFLSALTLLDVANLSAARDATAEHTLRPLTVLEVCCGLAQVLRVLEVDERPVATVGVDVVWSKLWLARLGLHSQARLLCADVAAAPLPLADDSADLAVCHDAVYFLENKAALLGELRRTAGSLLIGHAHNRRADHGDVAGSPLTPREYAALASPAACFFDDAAAAAACLDPDAPLPTSDGAGVDQFAEVEAIGWCEGPLFHRPADDDRSSCSLDRFRRRDFGVPPGRSLVPNPFLAKKAVTPDEQTANETRQLVVRWPQPRFAEEYATATYLGGDVPTPQQELAAAKGSWGEDPVLRDFVRRRTFIDAALIGGRSENLSFRRAERTGETAPNEAAPNETGSTEPEATTTNESSQQDVALADSSDTQPNPLVVPGPVGFGIVGCGWVARDYGAPALAAAGRVVYVCDPDPLALARMRAALGQQVGGAPAASHGLTDLLADEAVEAVYVATPNHRHADLVAACAAAGRPVLCEKPLAESVAAAEEMVAACERAGVTLATAFDQRWHPAHVAIRQLIEEGRLGTVTAARIHYACWLPPDWTPDGRPHDNWRVDANRAGGGAAIDLAPHGIDLLAILLGRRWDCLTAMTQAAVHDYADASVDDGAVLVGSLGPTLASLHVAYNCPDALPRRRLELIGTHGSLEAVDTMGQTAGGTLTLVDAASGRRDDVPFAREASPFVRQAEWFAALVRGTAVRTFTAADDLHHHRLLLEALHMANVHRTAVASSPHAAPSIEG